MSNVVLVNDQDVIVGTMEKLEAHRKGLLHRAFSVFIWNSRGDMLLQKRAMRKYHSGGLWSNACCSHPMEGEEIFSSAARRLKEETGIETPLEKIFDFVYKAAFENGLFEHEFDHVFAGIYDGDIALDAEEASDYTFKPMNAIRDELNTYPQKYTAWFHLAFEGAEKWYASHFEK